MAENHAPVVRFARRSDAGEILRLVDALAAYEHLAPPEAAARARLIEDVFGPRPRIRCLLGEVEGRAAGYAFTCETYSSFLALPTLYLEDLFVLPEFRKRRVGYALFTACVAEAQRGRYGRLEWTVLDWNRLAIDFYERLGATHMREWQLWRLTRPDFERILGGAGGV
ncbi:MAG: GNAT family N-acetyltransferase [Acidobacteria bacterium]|nr:GNAT family N-acetyltransferase [Acidobacteriota bacterium]MBI3281134.1 GNAT family N-acetyltransferase [Acidobacteriota bacterium]